MAKTIMIIDDSVSLRQVVGIALGAAGYDVCFLHPKANEQFPIAGEGVLIELVQAPPEVIAALRAPGAAPAVKIGAVPR